MDLQSLALTLADIERELLIRAAGEALGAPVDDDEDDEGDE